MKFRFLIFYVLILTFNTFAQNKKAMVIGKITYISSQNVYVNFVQTDGIKAEDTLFCKSGSSYLPAIKIKYISTTSCAGEKITSKELNVNDQLFAYVDVIIKKNSSLKDSVNAVDTMFVTDDHQYIKKEAYAKSRYRRSNINGRFSIQSYSNLSNSNVISNYQRWRYTFGLNAYNISDSKFSFSNFMYFTYKADDWSSVKSNLGNNFRVFDLALKYNFNEKTSLWFGRHLNSKISNLSTLDGLQFEKYFNQYYFGVVVGSRPNFSDMGLNAKLFEFGGYVGKTDSLGSGAMENTLAAFQQTNDFKTDRRFLYFQHNDDIFPNTRIFISSEIDLYKREMNQGKNDFSLTSLYLMTNYSPVRLFSLSLSYDARKNVIYYETFKSTLDSIIENETRQGFKARLNLRPINYVYLGIEGGYRFQKGDLRPTRNFNGYISYTRIPLLRLSVSASFTKIISSYIEGNIWGVRLAKNLFNDRLSVSLGLRNTLYKFTNSTSNLNQNSIEADLSTPIYNKLFFSISYEGAFEKNNTYNRILLGLTQRF